MIDDRAQYGRIPYEPIDAGLVAVLSCTAVRVYLAIAAHIDRQWTAAVSLDRLATLVGKSDRQVRRAINELIDSGAIEADRRGGRQMGSCAGRSSRFTLTSKADTLDVRLKGDIREREGGQPRSRRGTPTPSKADMLDVPRTDEQLEQAATEPADAGGAAGDPVVKSLDGHGIKPDVAVSLMRKVEGLTVGIVDKLALRAKRGDNPPGLLIHMIENDAPALIAAKATADARMHDDQVQRESASDRLVRERYSLHRDVIDAYVRGLDDVELAEAIKRAFRRFAGEPPTIEQARSPDGWHARTTLYLYRPTTTAPSRAMIDGREPTYMEVMR